MRYDKQNRRMERLKEALHTEKFKGDAATKEKERIVSILNTTMHEVRGLTSELANHASALSRNLGATERATEALTILHTAEMVTARLAYTDLQLNPAAITRQTRVPAGLYKKFEKARYVLSQSSREKQIEIKFQEHSYGMIDVLQAFELIPFIVLDNAIKYSPPHQIVEVTFSESSNQMQAFVSSIGPRLSKEEEARLFESQFRGEYAKQLPVYGAGLGLHIARSIADLHKGVTISARGSRDIKFELGGIPYSEFNVVITALR